MRNIRSGALKKWAVVSNQVKGHERSALVVEVNSTVV